MVPEVTHDVAARAELAPVAEAALPVRAAVADVPGPPDPTAGIMTEHAAVRPTWTCTGCASAWPCQTRRQQLTAEYDGAVVALSLYMVICFVEVSADLPHATVGVLYQRFLGWVRPR